MKYFLGPVFLLFFLIGVTAQESQTPLTQISAKPKPNPVAPKKVSAKTNSVARTKEQAIQQNSSSSPRTAGSQTTASSLKKTPAAKQKPGATPKPKIPKPPSEAEEYSKAAATENAEEKIAALKGFLEKFPASKKRPEALELIAITRIKLAEDKLTAAETESGIALLRTAIDELPTPVPERLYNDSLSKIPSDLFNNGQRTPAFDIAILIETKIGDNADQLLNLANFFLMIESGLDAKRVAEKAIGIAPSSAASQALGLACRLNFELDDASQAYAKALAIEPDAPAILRSLADLKRAQGKSDEATQLYRKILEKDPANAAAQTGLILALFDSGKRSDAEGEMAKSLDQNPNNVILLAGAAYWYAAHNEPDKAIDYSQQAIAKEPRYIWSHIALANGYLAKDQPAAAEEALLSAQRYGNFPTLEYELASARFKSGFYRDAAEELRKSFSIKDGAVHARLGGRVDSEQNSFLDLLANERRASIFEPASADSQETADHLKTLLEFDQIVNANERNEDAAATAADAFVGGDDRMKLHRQLYAASSLLSKRIALPKVTELAQAAVGNTDSALDVPDPGAAVMASELYDAKALALSRGELLKIPQVPRATLSAILRGRIEEIAGWTLFNQNQPAEAVIRLRRAVSVMPDKSAWWRSSMWRLGAALQADGKDSEALDSYIKSYSTDKPDGARYAVVESLYRKVHGNTEGFEAKIGPKPGPAFAQVPDPNSVAKNVGTAEPRPDASQSTDASPTVKIDPRTAKSDAKPTPEAGPTPAPQPSPTVVAEPTPGPSPESAATPAIVVTPTPMSSPDASPTPTPQPSPPVVLEPTPGPIPEATPAPVSSPEVSPTVTPQPSPDTVVEPTPSPMPEASATPVIAATPTPASSPVPAEPTPTQSPEVTPTAPESRPDMTKAEPSPSPTPDVTVEIKPADKSDSTEQNTTDTRAKSPDETNVTPVKKPDDSSVAENKATQLFEPVIITIPKHDTQKKAEISTAKKPGENGSTSDPAKTEAKPTDESAASPADSAISSGEVRPRVIAGKEAGPVDVPICSITVSQDSISILNNGGSLGILVHIEGDGDLRSIKAVSGSQDDIQVSLEPEIAGVKGQAFYVVHSLTTKTGEFKIVFVAPCGRKDVSVTVR